tara:strand:+ start:1845 stop:2999 length:1155 start_codon:yes stop_codon:yes gene_type:complete
MKKYIIFSIFFFIIIINNANGKDEVIFSLNKKTYTTIDLNNKIKYNLLLKKQKLNNENTNKIYQNIKNNLINDALFLEYINEKKINIYKSDIEDAYVNLLREITKGDEKKFIQLLKIYDLTFKDIEEQIIFEINSKIIDQQIEREFVNSKKNLKINDINEYIKYEINGFILYNQNNEYENQKKDIFNTFKNNKFDKAIEILNKKYLNKKIISNKYLDLNSISKKFKKLIINSNINDIIFYEDNNIFYAIKKTGFSYPNINLKYSFIQILSNNKSKIDLFSKKDPVCQKKEDYLSKNDSELKIRYYEEIDKKDINEKIFKVLNYKNNMIKIIKDNNHFLIYLCDITYDKDELANFVIKDENKADIENKKMNFVDLLKSRYNLFIY